MKIEGSEGQGHAAQHIEHKAHLSAYLRVLSVCSQELKPGDIMAI
jgi:hypothetical protein